MEVTSKSSRSLDLSRSPIINWYNFSDIFFQKMLCCKCYIYDLWNFHELFEYVLSKIVVGQNIFHKICICCSYFLHELCWHVSSKFVVGWTLSMCFINSFWVSNFLSQRLQMWSELSNIWIVSKCSSISVRPIFSLQK